MAETKLKTQDRTIKDFLVEHQGRIEGVKTKYFNMERFMNLAFSAFSQNRQLLECTEMSVLNALIKCATAGLELDGRLAYLVPFRNKEHNKTYATFIMGYMGMCQICRRTGEVADIQAEIVHKKDDFDYRFGTSKFLDHRPYEGEGDPGPITHVWTCVTFRNNGGTDFRVKNKNWIDYMRSRSKTPNNGPWVTDYEEMGKKALFRNHFKWLPFSAETWHQIRQDEDEAIDIDAEVVKPRRITRREPFADTSFPTEADDNGETGTPAQSTLPETKEAVSETKPAQTATEEEPLPAHKKPKGRLFS